MRTFDQKNKGVSKDEPKQAISRQSPKDCKAYQIEAQQRVQAQSRPQGNRLKMIPTVFDRKT